MELTVRKKGKQVKRGNSRRIWRWLRFLNQPVLEVRSLNAVGHYKFSEPNVRSSGSVDVSGMCSGSLLHERKFKETLL